MGPMPVIFGGVTQEGNHLKKKEVKQLRKAVDVYHRRFPQSRLHLMVRTFPQEMELPVILFWIFNNAGLSSEGSKGGRNRDVVLLIEPNRGQAGMIVGYGLEPILAKEAMNDVVGRARGFLMDGDFAEAFNSMIDTLSECLKAISEGLPEAVGLPVKLAEEDGDQY